MRRWGRAAAALGFVLAGSAAAAERPPSGKCVMYQVDDLKVRLTHNRAMLDGAVNGQPVRVLIDTGAATSIMFRAKAEALHIPLADAPGVRMGGAGGTTRAQVGFLDGLKLAGSTLPHVRMLVAGEGRDADFDILLGEDVLGRFDIEFDLGHGAVRLLQPRNCGEGDMAYWTREYYETPLVAGTRDAPFVVVRLNGRPVRAELDSGASSSVGTPHAAAVAGVKLEAVAAKGHGIGGAALTNEVGVLDSFAIGEETIRNARLRFSDLFGLTTFDETGTRIARHMDDEPEMLLGFDFLKSHRVLISRSRRKLYFTYEGGPVFDTRRGVAPAGGAATPAADGAATSAPAPSEGATPQAASRAPAGS